MRAHFSDLKTFLRYFGFWLLMSFVDRFIFILSFYDKINWSTPTDLLRIYFHGLSLDLSLAAYICALPFLGYCIAAVFPKIKFMRKALDIYTLLLIVIFSLTTFVNINIYREWGDKISKRAIDAVFEDAGGAVASAESTPVLIPILGIVCLIIGGYWLYRKLMPIEKYYPKKSAWTIAIQFCLIGLLIFTFIRGGYGKAPLNPSRSYFSSTAFYNHAAVNTQYALMREYFTRNQRQRSPYKYWNDAAKANELLKPAFAVNPDSSRHILKVAKPNVVLVLLESFVADLVESLGGEPGITPHLEEIIKGGVSFNQIYAASDRSDKGLVAVFGGFPAQGPESIIKYIDKHENMPAIGQEFQAAGYKTSFFHGGQSEFYNMKSYMLSHGIEQIVDNINFSPLDPRTSWGVYDHVVFQKMLETLNEEQEPFFSSIFTLVNHEPFTLNAAYKFGNNSNVNKFKSTAYYTDESIFNFLEEAKKEPWYKNTLFVFIADHGHRLPAEKYDINHPKRFHIPMVFYGDVIKEEYRGLKVNVIGNQTDLPNTLLTQLNLPTNRYTWSRDLLNTTLPSIAFYNSKDAFAVVHPDQVLSYDRVGNVINYISNPKNPKNQTDSLLNMAKAYYEQVYEDFMKF